MTRTGKVLLAAIFMGGVAVGAASVWYTATAQRERDLPALDEANARIEELRHAAESEKAAEASKRGRAAAGNVLAGAALEVLAAGELDPQAAMENFAKAFREHGLDLLAGSIEDAAGSWRAEGSVESLAAYADAWRLCARAARREDRASRLLEVLLLADPDPVRVSLRRALAAEDLDAARSAFAGTNPAQSPATARLHGMLLRELGAPAEALEPLRAARLARPNDVALLLELAACTKGPERVECLAVAAALRPASAGLHARWAGALLDAGEIERASRTCDRALELAPSNALAIELRSRILFDSGRLEDALNLLRRAVAAAPNETRLRTKLGVLLAATGRDREAKLVLEEVLVASPDQVEALRELSKLCSQSKDSVVFDPGRAERLKARADELETR